MPLNVRRLYTSVLLGISGFVVFAGAQTPPQTAPQRATPQATPQQTPQAIITPPPTSGDVMRERISKAKAYTAVRNYSAAIYELENIRRESKDPALLGVVNVLLMNSYLEQGDYKRAQDFLNEFYTAQKTRKTNASTWYMAVAGQVVKGARNRVERYRSLGLSVSDRTLPLEATNDLEKIRETLELVITQSKDIGKDKARMPDAMALLEEASNSRTMLARDDYDANHWRNEVADTREEMASSRSVVMDATNETPSGDQIAENTHPTEKPLSTPPVVMNKTVSTGQSSAKQDENKPSETVAENKPVYVPNPPPPNVNSASPNVNPASPTVKEEPKQSAGVPNVQQQVPNTEAAKDGSPIDVGSLVAYATNSPSPIYPQVAKSLRTTGVVKVEVTVNETGDVSTVQKASGPAMLQAAAKDAIRKWKFKPFVRDGQPVKATGFVSFNFAL